MVTEGLFKKYTKAAEEFRLLTLQQDRKLFLLSMLRLLCFAGGFFLSWYSFNLGIAQGILVLLLSLLLFVWLLKLYSDHTEKRDFLNNLSEINSREARAMDGDTSFFASGAEFSDKDHPFSSDIDIFGSTSVFQYLNRTVTSYGREILANWVSDPYLLSPNILKRQETIKELAGKEQWRQEFMAKGYKNPLEKKEISLLLDWLNEDGEYATSTFKRYMVIILPGTALIFLFLLIAGILPYSAFIFIFLVNLLFVAAGLKKTNRIHSILTRKYYFLLSMDSLLSSFGKEMFNSEILKEIKEKITGKGVSASVSVRKLGRLIQSFDTRLNMFVGIILNGLLLWDYQNIRRLEMWKSEYKAHFPVWLDMLGEVDAFISLGNYAFNNPGFSYPVLSSSDEMFSATNIGHPLIKSGDRVCNDFIILKKGSVGIITGANMAGKSTFLRTIAVNYIFAMIGAPVCASEMKFRPVMLFTSMRTTDSLSDHESYFYAELKRLKHLKLLVDKGEPVMFILDEILKGTNSADKSTGSKLFIKRLIVSGGTGIIATHDISIGEMETVYPFKIFNKCFEVEIDGEDIRFDYILRDGITNKMNAALLMKQMGILD